MPKEVDALLGALEKMPCSKRIFRAYAESLTPLVSEALGVPERRIKVEIRRTRREDNSYTKAVEITLAMPEPGADECGG